MEGAGFCRKIQDGMADSAKSAFNSRNIPFKERSHTYFRTYDELEKSGWKDEAIIRANAIIGDLGKCNISLIDMEGMAVAAARKELVTDFIESRLVFSMPAGVAVQFMSYEVRGFSKSFLRRKGKGRSHGTFVGVLRFPGDGADGILDAIDASPILVRFLKKIDRRDDLRKVADAFNALPAIMRARESLKKDRDLSRGNRFAAEAVEKLAELTERMKPIYYRERREKARLLREDDKISQKLEALERYPEGIRALSVFEDICK